MDTLFDSDLQAIADQLKHLVDGVDVLDVDRSAFEELQRLAGLQTIRLHSGQSIMRQIDSMIKGWRRRVKGGGGSAVQAAHYIDSLQLVRIAIFGESLQNEDGAEELIAADIDAEFDKFVKEQQVDAADQAAARKGFEAAWSDDVVLSLQTDVVSVNGVFYKKMDKSEVKKYGFS